MFDAKRANIANRFPQPFSRAQRLDGEEQISHVLIGIDVEAALYARKAVVSEDAADVRIRLRDALRVMQLGIGNDQIKRNR